MGFLAAVREAWREASEPQRASPAPEPEEEPAELPTWILERYRERYWAEDASTVVPPPMH